MPDSASRRIQFLWGAFLVIVGCCMNNLVLEFIVE
jgi:hypothetical protein